MYFVLFAPFQTLLDTRHVLILDSLSQLMDKKQPLPEHEHVSHCHLFII